MKVIPVKSFAEKDMNTVTVLKTIVGAPASQGLRIDAMRKRVRLLDILDTQTEDDLYLEDADYAELVNVLNSHVFGAASRELVEIVDDVLTAVEPAKVE